MDKLKDNSKLIESQMKQKVENKPKVMNETEEKINKDLLNDLKVRNLIWEIDCMCFVVI